MPAYILGILERIFTSEDVFNSDYYFDARVPSVPLLNFPFKIAW